MSVGRCGHRPLRKRNKRCNGRATARVAPTKALQGVRRGERNPLVTASPSQPPLGKGAEGTGDADCHSQCAHWLRNDTLLEIRYKPGGRTEASAPTEGLQGARKNGRGRTPPLRRAYKECGKRAAGDMQEEASLRPPFGFLGKKIPASKAGSILPYYAGGDNERKKFAEGYIL